MVEPVAVILFAAFRILVLRNMMIGDGFMAAMAMFSVTEALLDQKNSFSTVFQDFKVFSLTVGENILMRRTAEDDAELLNEALRESGMMGIVSSFKYGYDTMMTREFDEGGVSLSGGQVQKIALSRLYAKNAPIAILDEPSSALDPVAEYELFENMKRICEGRTVIFISHRLSSAISADVIFMMEHGRIIERGNHESLMR